MARMKLKSLLTSFTQEGDYFAVLSSDGILRIWSTSDGSLLGKWSPLGAHSDAVFSCMACSFIGKKRKKGRGTCLLVLGSSAGEILAFDAFTGDRKWNSAEVYAGGIAGLSFTNKGHVIHTVGSNGMASEINSESGEVVRDFNVSKTPITCSAFCTDEKTFVIARSKIRVFDWDTGKEMLKFSVDGGQVQHVFVCEDKKALISFSHGAKYLQVWKPDLKNGGVSKGPLLRTRHPLFSLDCKPSCNAEEALVLSVSGTGVAYVWSLKFSSEEEISPIKVTVQASKFGMDMQDSGSAKKNQFTIIGSRLQASDTNEKVTALIAYGSVDSLRFASVDISSPSEDIVITAEDEATNIANETVLDDKVPAGKGVEEEDAPAVIPINNKKGSKKRAASDPDLADAENVTDTVHEEQIDDDINEPTMGEKLARLNLQDNKEIKTVENEESSQNSKPPSADTVHILMKQALHADDRALLLNCLSTQDEKVIVNSVSLLSPSDVLKLLDSLISIIHSRGAVLVLALPWLRSLLLQHASGIMSQESSLAALNSLYQLIESRVSTFVPALQLSSRLDLLYKGTVDDGIDENDTITPIIFEDRDESEEEDDDELEDAMETDQKEDDDDDEQPLNDDSDIDDMNFD